MGHPVNQRWISVTKGARGQADNPVLFIDNFKKFTFLHLNLLEKRKVQEINKKVKGKRLKAKGKPSLNLEP
jgi:hypothetical protein